MVFCVSYVLVISTHRYILQDVMVEDPTAVKNCGVHVKGSCSVGTAVL